MPSRLILASTSPYRRALLKRLRVRFATMSPGIDERAHPDEAGEGTAARLAEAKARAVAAVYPDAVVIGSDQVAMLEGRPLGKPGTHEAALAQLLASRGKIAVFHTAVCVLGGGTSAMQIANVPTTVYYRNYSEVQAQHYLELDQPYDCAGSAKIEGLGIALVERVESVDPTALIGLPLIALVGMLQRAGIAVPPA